MVTDSCHVRKKEFTIMHYAVQFIMTKLSFKLKKQIHVVVKCLLKIFNLRKLYDWHLFDSWKGKFNNGMHVISSNFDHLSASLYRIEKFLKLEDYL